MNVQDPESFTTRPTPESGTHAHDSQSTIHSDLTNILQRAAVLARKEDLSQAENLLTPLIEGNTSRIEAMDLLAKIYAQQGRINQAQALWLKASQREPSNLHFLAALRLCAYYEKPRIQQFVLLHSGLLIAVCLWWLLVMVIVLYLNV